MEENNLGTGGLVRAYSGAVEKAIKKAEIIQKTKGYEAKINVDYNYLKALRYYLEKMNIKILNIEYSENIEITVEMNRRVSQNNLQTIITITILKFQNLIS